MRKTRHGGGRAGSGEGMQQRIKVWYRRVDVQRVARSASRPRWTVALDGRPIQTPAKAPLELPTKPLALAVAMEWQAQTKMLQPHTMPLMKLATTSIDQIPSIRPTMHSSMLRTMETDVACMRADPEEEPVRVARVACSLRFAGIFLRQPAERFAVCSVTGASHKGGCRLRRASRLACRRGGDQAQSKHVPHSRAP